MEYRYKENTVVAERRQKIICSWCVPRSSLF